MELEKIKAGQDVEACDWCDFLFDASDTVLFSDVLGAGFCSKDCASLFVMKNALLAIVALMDGSQPIDHPGALIVAQYALREVS